MLSVRRILVVVVLVVVVAVSAVSLMGSEPRAVSYAEASFVGSSTCARCHAEAFETWQDSHHDLAMDPATPATVLGDFSAAPFEHFGVTTSFRRDGERFFMRTDGPDGAMQDYEVRYVFGVEPLQQYLVDFDGGRMQCLPVAWDSVGKKWFHLYPNEGIPAGDVLHWTGPNQNWNYMCASCHSTDLRRGWDGAGHSYHTKWSEIDVACEACHGPGSEHVAWAEGGQSGFERKGFAPGLDGSQRSQLDTCAPCHSRRAPLVETPPHGASFDDTHRLELLRDPLYEVDGQIRDEVYVYGSFLQSRMYHEGVKCTDCHDPHTARLKFQGNALCTQCHEVAKFDTPAHHHHAAGTAGANCVDCHMAQRTYMVVDPRRDHSFRVPRPDLTVRFGVPNACDACHADQGAEWSAARIVDWFGEQRHVSPVTNVEQWTEAFAAARAQSNSAIRKLEALASSTMQPAIVRATALALAPDHGFVEREVIAGAVDDEDPLVRTAACTASLALPPEFRVDLVGKLLQDPVRTVRVEAARALAACGAEVEALPGARDAFDDFVTAQLAIGERAGAHLNLGVFWQDRGEARRAEQAYREAIELDPNFRPARFNLANLLDSMGRGADAEEHLQVLVTGPEGERDGQAHYSLGLLLASLDGRMPDAERALTKASALLPENARLFYNLGLARQTVKNLQGARAALETAHRIDASDADVVHALALFWRDRGVRAEAVRYAEKLMTLRPGRGAQELMQAVNQM